MIRFIYFDFGSVLVNFDKVFQKVCQNFSLNMDEFLEFYDKFDLDINLEKVSASYIQRKFNLGYARSARLLDQLEENGIIGPLNGAKPREILTKNVNDLNKKTLKKNIAKAKRKKQIEWVMKWIYRFIKIILITGLFYLINTFIGFEITVFLGIAFVIENIISKRSIWE